MPPRLFNRKRKWLAAQRPCPHRSLRKDLQKLGTCQPRSPMRHYQQGLKQLQSKRMRLLCRTGTRTMVTLTRSQPTARQQNDPESTLAHCQQAGAQALLSMCAIAQLQVCRTCMRDATSPLPTCTTRSRLSAPTASTTRLKSGALHAPPPKIEALQPPQPLSSLKDSLLRRRRRIFCPRNMAKSNR